MTDLDARTADVRRTVSAALDGAGDGVEAAAGAIRAILEEAGHVAHVLVSGTRGFRSIGLVSGVWSPSLHPASADKFMVQAGMSHDEVLDLVSTPIARQVRACEDARRHGVPWQPVSDEHVDHLHVDRSLIAIGVDGVRNMRDHLRQAIVRLHAPASVRYGGSGILSRSGEMVTEVEADDGVVRVLQLATWARRDPWFPFDGETLSMPDMAVPDTVMALMQGRPLRDLAVVHPALDDRIVTSMSRTSSGGPPYILVTLVPDRVRLADAF
jgi:hypothetical protein